MSWDTDRVTGGSILQIPTWPAQKICTGCVSIIPVDTWGNLRGFRLKRNAFVDLIAIGSTRHFIFGQQSAWTVSMWLIVIFRSIEQSRSVHRCLVWFGFHDSDACFWRQNRKGSLDRAMGWQCMSDRCKLRWSWFWSARRRVSLVEVRWNFKT